MKQYEDYETMNRIAKYKYLDSGYCSVIATATVTGLSFARARRKLERLGRKWCKGLPYGVYKKAIEQQGYKVTTCRYDLVGTTVNQAAKQLPQGKFLIRINKHVLAIVDGVVNDWSEGRKFKVKSIHQVTKEEA